jgi:hypothetical protein
MKSTNQSHGGEKKKANRKVTKQLKANKQPVEQIKMNSP